MKNQYIFLDSAGNVKSTLKTDGVFVESSTCKKVDNVELYIGKKRVNGEFVAPIAHRTVKSDVSSLSIDEKLDLLLKHFGLAE